MQIRLMFVLILTNPVCLLEEKKKSINPTCHICWFDFKNLRKRKAESCIILVIVKVACYIRI